LLHFVDASPLTSSTTKQIRQAQALHMLQHRYSPVELEAAVEEGLARAPPPALEAPASFAAVKSVEDWHDAQWAALKASVDGDT
jgi:hypothetical protein